MKEKIRISRGHFYGLIIGLCARQLAKGATKELGRKVTITEVLDMLSRGK